MSDIERFVTIWGGVVMHPSSSGNWVRYDDHRAEVERLREERDEAHSTIYRLASERDKSNSEVERLTFERDQAQAEVKNLNAQMTDAIVRIRALTAERDEAQAEVERLTAELHRTRADGIELRWVADEVEQLTAQRDAAQAEVERLKEQVRALTVAVEQADEMKAHAEASAAAEEAETDRVMAERDAAQVDVERLKNAIDHLTSERDEARDERDAVQRERERVQALLWLRGRELPTLQRDQPAQNLDMANGQAILDSSRHDDETIWREAFMAAVHDVHKNWMDVADVALAQYRKRWPR